MNIFEEISNEVDNRNNYESSVECSIEWINNNKTATVTFPGRSRYCSKIKKLNEQYPEEVIIRHINQDGSIVATLPVKYIKISHPKSVTREYTEEEKEILRERMKHMQDMRKSK